MSLDTLKKYLSQIKPLDAHAMAEARARHDSLAKPHGSLGKLEYIAVRLAGISGRTFYGMGRCCVIIIASNNGVVEVGVAPAPQSVTRTQTLNFTKWLADHRQLRKGEPWLLEFLPLLDAYDGIIEIFCKGIKANANGEKT